MRGAFQTSREIFEHPIWHDIPKFRIFFYIYGNAVYSQDGVTIGDIHLKRGQLLRSYRQLQEDLKYIENRSIKKYSLSLIKRKIDSLVEENRLKIEDTELGTLFTVVNYELYQGFDMYDKTNIERRENADRTARERSENNNKKDKNDIEREREREDETNPFRMFEENIRMLNAYERESLIAWCNDLGDELVMEAIKYSVQQGARTYKYLDYKLRRWVEKGVKDKNDAWVAEMELEEERKRKVVNMPNRNVGVGGIDWDNI